MKILINAGDSVVIESTNGERVVVTASQNISFDRLKRELEKDKPDHAMIEATTFLSIRLDALQGRVPFAGAGSMPNNHFIVNARSIADLEED